MEAPSAFIVLAQQSSIADSRRSLDFDAENRPWVLKKACFPALLSNYIRRKTGKNF
jgi:hypothetical protein